MSIQEVHILNNPIHTFGYPLGDAMSKKHRLGPQNGPGSSGPKKIAKNQKCQKTVLS
jgi:hypothetical protein